MKITLTDVYLPVRLRTETPLTDEEIMRFCSANDIIDLERSADGWLELRPIAGTLTGGILFDISCDLWEWNREEQREGVVLQCPGFTLPDTSLLSPSAAWIDRETWNAKVLGQHRRFAMCAPYFLIELVTSSRSVQMLQNKMALWMANGVQLAWLVDIDARSVTIYRHERPAEVIKNANQVEGEGLLAGFVLNLGKYCT